MGRNLHMCFTKIKESESPNSPIDNFKNYNSLYDYTFDSTSKSPPPPRRLSSSSSEPDFATVFASQRFFFSSPGRSNSIVESTEESSDSPVSQKCKAPISDLSDRSITSESWRSPKVKDSVAVPTYSPDPYLDFRQSMEEMVEARGLMDVKGNWENLHELLLCYLALNPKSTHKFIVRAFADLLVSLLASPLSPPSPMEE
ncbi:transcription repressor OFP16-like [Euphorbia lathyris]|uniref:transcription repressor OFP16-like n=1 Tax=Euphorbia lathyris TaxID=212925 RepID=UPI00331365CA